MINYILGLDIGIGSIGWAAINLDKQRIEDFGVRIFDSGESNNGKDRLSQDRRRYRGMRRLVRRRSHRKERLKKYLSSVGLTTIDKICEYYESSQNNVIELRYKGLAEKISPEEIAACLIHICNNRGYKDFYAINMEDIDDPSERKEYEKETEGISHINKLMEQGGYRTPAEMICKCSEFDEPNSVFRKFHNSDSSDKVNLISRSMLESEVSLILEKQKDFYGNDGKPVHHGLFPEKKIITAMNEALGFLNNGNCDRLIRIAAFHFLFCYIHPFYDGNGRMSRFISCYLLSKYLNPLIGYRLSYTVKERLGEYYKGFTICEHPNSRGELTPFVEMFLQIILQSEEQLLEELTDKYEKLTYYEKLIPSLPNSGSKYISEIYELLIQASLFSHIGISRSDLMKYINIGKSTLSELMKLIPGELLISNRESRRIYYMLDTDKVVS